MKIIIFAALLVIVVTLVMAGRAMLRSDRKDPAKNNRMVNALAWRVGLSIALFLFILLSWKLGWIQPTGIAAGR